MPCAHVFLTHPSPHMWCWPVIIPISPVTFQRKKNKLSIVLFDRFTAPTTPPSPFTCPPTYSHHPYPCALPLIHAIPIYIPSLCSFMQSPSICGSGPLYYPQCLDTHYNVCNDNNDCTTSTPCYCDVMLGPG